ncbi:MAG: HAD-IB family hydrolase [Actinobacteria bacterium ATB1]|nr:HAD-IB family hydrolase [Actinobacteria bacterium ATB1]
MTPAAFFDLDRTVMSGASTYHFARAALRRGMYKRRAIFKFAWQARRFRASGLGDAKTIAARDQMLEAVAGRHRREMDVLLPEAMAPILSNVYPQMYEVILAHEDAGVPTYLCSASPIEIVGAVARVMNMSGGALATRAAVDSEGRYTGELDGPWCYGTGKAEAVAAEAKRAGIDLARSAAYSDSVSDIPMLELVGKPVAVNPDAELKALALERGWDILRLEPHRGARAAAGAGIAAGATAAALASAMWVTRRAH